MKDEKYPFGLAFTLILFSIFFGTISFMDYKQEVSKNTVLFMEYKQEAGKRIVFQECLRRADELTDDTICNCAEFVGKPDWCDDLNY